MEYAEIREYLRVSRISRDLRADLAYELVRTGADLDMDAYATGAFLALAVPAREALVRIVSRHRARPSVALSVGLDDARALRRSPHGPESVLVFCGCGREEWMRPGSASCTECRRRDA